MSDAEEPFQMVKHKRSRRKHNVQTQLHSPHQEPCHIDDDLVEPCIVLEKLQHCR